VAWRIRFDGYTAQFNTLCSTSCFIILSSCLVRKCHKEAFSRERRSLQLADDGIIFF